MSHFALRLIDVQARVMHVPRKNTYRLPTFNIQREQLALEVRAPKKGVAFGLIERQVHIRQPIAQQQPWYAATLSQLPAPELAELVAGSLSGLEDAVGTRHHRV